MKLPSKKKKPELEGVVSGDMKNTVKDKPLDTQVSGLKEDSKTHIASSDIKYQSRLKVAVSNLRALPKSKKLLLGALASLILVVFIIGIAYAVQRIFSNPDVITISTQSDSQNSEKLRQRYLTYVDGIEKTAPPSTKNSEERLAYYTALITGAISESKCDKAIKYTEEYGLNSDLQKLTTTILEPVGTCYILANNKPKAAIVLTANLKIYQQTRANKEVDPADIPYLDGQILQAQRLLGATK